VIPQIATPAPPDTGADPTVQKNGFSEYDFIEEPSLRIQGDHTAIIFLEPEDATETEISDTDRVGADLIPLYISPAGTYSYGDVNKLLSSKSCPNGDLRGARLFNASLPGANLTGANL